MGMACNIASVSWAYKRLIPHVARHLNGTECLQIVEETIPELVKLKKEGLVRYIGITGLPLPIYKNVLDRWGSSHTYT